jgi:hypothetical protein
MVQHWQTSAFEDIVDPDAAVGPGWLWRLATRLDGPGVLTVSAATVAAILGLTFGIAGGAVAGLVAGVPLVAGVVAAGVTDARVARHRVTGIDPKLDGQEIVGEGLALLTDISKRFAFARRKIAELPDLVDWRDLEPAVEAIRWDAARHAAELSRSEDRWRDVQNAPPGTPQAALRARIAAERADELEILRGYQRSADRLMNRAADAAAAAVVASEMGYDLEVAVPSASAAKAKETLEAVIARLDALTAAWRALDPSTDLAAEELRRDVAAHERARALSARLDRATGKGATDREAAADEGSG